MDPREQHRLTKAIRTLCVVAVVATPSLQYAQQPYRHAYADAHGQLRITLANGSKIRPPKDSGQVAFDQVVLSPDHRSIGWLALYPNSSTTYPIPLKLVVLTGGARHSFKGNGLPVWRWTFADNARQVAFRQAPIHGDNGTHFELRDVKSGLLVSSYDPDTAKRPRIPRWARPVQH